ncbi:hypothetical protein FKM82_001871 [Ascaphus truei]
MHFTNFSFSFFSDSPLPVTSRVCFVKFLEANSAVVAQHLTNTVFVDRALIVVPYAEGVIPDEAKALSLLAPANAVAGLLPGGGLLPTPNSLTQSLAADQLLKLMSSVDPKLNHVTAGLVSPSLKSDASNKDIEEAMKRVREAQSLISAAIEPDKKDGKGKKHSRSRSRSRRKRTPSSSRHRRSRSRSRRRSHSKSRSRRRSKSPRKRHSDSRERGRRSSRSTSKTREKKKAEKEMKRSKTPPKSYSTARRSRSASRERRRRKSQSGSRSPKKARSPKRKPSRSPSPNRRHKKEKKKDKEREKNRDERERSTSKKKKSKDKEKERERKSESDKDVKQVTRDYDEEEQGYDSEKEKRDEDLLVTTDSSPPQMTEASIEKASGDSAKDSKLNGDDHHEEDMDMSD